MARTNFRGPVCVGNRDTAYGTLVASRNVLLTPAAQANTDIPFQMPAGRILRMNVYTTTPYTGTTVTAQLGTTVGGSELAPATNIKPGGIAAMALTAAALNETTVERTLHARLVQTGPSAVGVARVVIEYVPVLND